jgi:hypothetical protein
MTWEEKYFLECLEQAERERNLPKPVKPRKPRMEKPKPVFKTTLQIRAEQEAAELRRSMRESAKTVSAEDEENAAISELLAKLLEDVAVSHPESIIHLMWDGDLPRSTKRKTSEAKEDYDSWKPRWNGTE